MADEEFGDVPADAYEFSPDEQQQEQQNVDRNPDASAVVPSQAVPVVGVPNYPNCIAWSEENLLAVGAGHLVTILDPASTSGPRGFIPVASSPVFDFGRVQTEDLKAHSLFEICLARDPRPGVRSFDWSPPGLAQNGGSLLALCTTDARVKVYRIPFCDFQSEWVEIIDLSEMVFNHCLNNGFREAEQAAAQLASEEGTIPPPRKWGFGMKRKLSNDGEPQHRKVQKARHHATDNLVVVPAAPEVSPIPNVGQHGQARVVSYGDQPASIVKGSRVEVLEEDDVQYWVSGLVAEIVNGEALVKLDRPQYGAMQEWVPLQRIDDSDREEEADQPSAGNSASQRDGIQVMQTQRPRIRPEKAIDTLERSVTNQAGGEGSLVSGDLVEAWINDRWQEGMVVEVVGFGVSVSFSASSMNAIVEPKNLRLAPIWHGEKGIWKTTDAFSNQEAAVSCINNNDVSRTEENAGQFLLDDSSERQHVDGQREGQIQNVGGKMRGQVTTGLELCIVPEKSAFPDQSGSGQDLSHDMTREETSEKQFSRVYKRRGPVATKNPPRDAPSAEISSARPTRNRRLPSKLRTEDTVSWMTENEYDFPPEIALQDKDGDYVQKLKSGKDKAKAKSARPSKNAAPKVMEAKCANDNTGKMKEAEGRKVGEKEKQDKNENCIKPKWISPHDYAARSEFLTPLSLAWSSKYKDQGIDDGSGGSRAQTFVLLGAGMKSGRVSVWRMACPPSYSIDHSDAPVAASFLGFLFAHESWVNNLSWATCCNFELGKLNELHFPKGDGPSGDTLLLATGSADGSVKLWAGLSSELTGSDCAKDTPPFILLREVVEADCMPVTALALCVPSWPGDRALLAVGKGSGSVGVWELKSSGVFRQSRLQPCAHQQMVTGFSWAPDGRCLYSCGQDSLKRWNLSQNELLPLPFPDGGSLFPPSTASDICNLETLESFFGVTLSPNGLALAAVRGIASDLLDQMYQARSQKGLVQFFWLGNEHIDAKNGACATLPSFARPLKKAMSGHDKVCWELNIVDALDALQDPRKPLVLWDVVAALSSLKEKLGIEEVVYILSKWLSSWAQGEGALGAIDSHEWATGSFQKAIPEASCRRLQLLNILYRRLLLSHVKMDVVGAPSFEDPSKGDDMKGKVWKDCLYLVEHELRQRLVHINLQSAFLEGYSRKNATEIRNSLGVQLLVEWVLSNIQSVDPELGKLATKLQTTKGNKFANRRPPSPMEACTFCDSSVALESPEVATCSGSEIKHRLQRCSVSMLVCPPVCLWHCSCCGRSAIKQASSLFVRLSSREQMAECSLPVLNNADSFPFCPFCGIVMHRLLPNFFLTPSLV